LSAVVSQRASIARAPIDRACRSRAESDRSARPHRLRAMTARRAVAVRAPRIEESRRTRAIHAEPVVAGRCSAIELSCRSRVGAVRARATEPAFRARRSRARSVERVAAIAHAPAVAVEQAS
jgi:hypothetical protein